MDLQIFMQKFLEPLTFSGSFLFHGKHSPLAAIAVADKREALTAIAAADNGGWKKQYAAYCKKAMYSLRALAASHRIWQCLCPDEIKTAEKREIPPR